MTQEFSKIAERCIFLQSLCTTLYLAVVQTPPTLNVNDNIDIATSGVLSLIFDTIASPTHRKIAIENLFKWRNLIWKLLR